jgi:serine O-acetyltransferase
MFELFKQDVQRWIRPQDIAHPSEVTFLKTLKLLFIHMPVRAMFWFRLGAWAYRRRIPFSKGIVYRILYRNHGLELSPDIEVGGGLYIAHPNGCVIHAKRIGKNCSVISNVTVGMRNRWEFPTIGDNVFIGAGARILGGINVGNGARIGANAVVIDDVPDGATVVGIPARVLGAAKPEMALEPDQNILADA